MKALIIGATGATGKDLVEFLLQDPEYTEVVIFVRRTGHVVHPKLQEVLTEFDKLELVSDQIKGGVWFNCMGTTLKVAGSKDKQWHIDYEIPLKFAEIAKRNGISRAVLLSAYGASVKSKVFYSKMKGTLEEAMGYLQFDQYIIFRPGFLLRKSTDRRGELVIAGALKLINRLGLVKKFRPLPTSVLAEKMAKSPKILSNGKHIIELDKIFQF